MRGGGHDVCIGNKARSIELRRYFDRTFCGLQQRSGAAKRARDCRIWQIRIGVKRQHPSLSRQRRGVPPAMLNGLNLRARINRTVLIVPVQPQAYERVMMATTGTELFAECGRTTAGINQHLGLHLRAAVRGLKRHLPTVFDRGHRIKRG